MILYHIRLHSLAPVASPVGMGRPTREYPCWEIRRSSHFQVHILYSCQFKKTTTHLIEQSGPGVYWNSLLSVHDGPVLLPGLPHYRTRRVIVKVVLLLQHPGCLMH